MEAEQRGRRDELVMEFPLLEDPFLVDALTWCDMTTTPDGEPSRLLAGMSELAWGAAGS
jgi:hypothetical protein